MRMNPVNIEKGEKVRALVAKGELIGVACKQVGLAPSVYWKFRQEHPEKTKLKPKSAKSHVFVDLAREPVIVNGAATSSEQSRVAVVFCQPGQLANILKEFST